MSNIDNIISSSLETAKAIAEINETINGSVKKVTESIGVGALRPKAGGASIPVDIPDYDTPSYQPPTYKMPEYRLPEVDLPGPDTRKIIDALDQKNAELTEKTEFLQSKLAESVNARAASDKKLVDVYGLISEYADAIKNVATTDLEKLQALHFDIYKTLSE